MKVFETSFNRISRNKVLRFDFGLRFIDDVLDFNPLKLRNNYITLGNVLEEISSKKIKKGDLDRPYKLIDLENILKKFNALENVIEVTSLNSDKSILGKGDIIIAKMTPQLGTIYLNEDHEELLGSTELIEYKIHNYEHLSLFYLLTSKKFLDALGYLESGKIQRRVNSSDLLKLKIPKSEDINIDKIKKYNKKINSLLSRRQDLFEIIDKSFYDNLKINHIEAKKRFDTKLSIIGTDDQCRFSFHNQFYYKSFEYNKMMNEDWCPITKKFKISGGKRIPKGYTFSSSVTPYFYLRPQETSIYGIDRENIPNINEYLFNRLKHYAINSNEFCLSNVGTLGKVGLIDLEDLGIEEGKLIMSENFAKLSPLVPLNYKFYYFFFNSYIFKKQMDREYTITSQPKLGLDKIKKLTIPNFSKELEKKVISEIEDDLNTQREIFRKLDEVREQADSIFDN